MPRRLRNELEVFVVPTVNPDGNVLGRNAFNAEGFDMYQAFGDHPDANLPEAHESRLLWEWVTAERPALWMNFHCFTGWRLNSEFPYDGWYEVEDYGLFSDAGQRRLYAALCDTMRLETDGPSTHERASIHRPNTLCYQFAKRFDIPHAFYEINNGTAGKHLGHAAGNSRFQTRALRRHCCTMCEKARAGGKIVTETGVLCGAHSHRHAVLGQAVTPAFASLYTKHALPLGNAPLRSRRRL